MFAVTLILTLTVPLQWAIIGGAMLSLIARVVASASAGELQLARRDEHGWLLSDDVPATLMADEPVLLRYSGPNFFADATTMADQLPEPDPTRPGVLVLDVGALRDFSITTLRQLSKYHDKVAAAGSGLVLAGIDEAPRLVFARTDLSSPLGEQNIRAGDPHLGAALDAGLQRGRELLAELQAARTPTPGSGRESAQPGDG